MVSEAARHCRFVNDDLWPRSSRTFAVADQPSIAPSTESQTLGEQIQSQSVTQKMTICTKNKYPAFQVHTFPAGPTLPTTSSIASSTYHRAHLKQHPTTRDSYVLALRRIQDSPQPLTNQVFLGRSKTIFLCLSCRV